MSRDDLTALADRIQVEISPDDLVATVNALRAAAVQGEPVAYRWLTHHNNMMWSFGAYAPSDAVKVEPLYRTTPAATKSADTGGGVRYAEGEAPWSEDEQFAEAAKACKSRCKQYKMECDGEFEGDCTECEHDAQVALRKKYLSQPAPVVANASAEARLREALARFSVHEYVDGYEYRGDQDYKPNEQEQALLEDAINGVIAEIEALSRPAPVVGNGDLEAAIASGELAPAGSMAVAVKQLEWVHVSEGPRCITVCGIYAIHPSSGPYGQPTLTLTGLPGDLFGKFKSIDAAKAAAQSDYDLRIISALSQPAPVVANASAEARLREALEPFAVLGRGLYEANQRSDQSVLIGASAEFLNLRPLIGQHFVNAYLALSAHPHASDCDRFKHFAPDGGKAPIRPDAPDHLTVKTSAEMAHASDCDKQGER